MYKIRKLFKASYMILVARALFEFMNELWFQRQVNQMLWSGDIQNHSSNNGTRLYGGTSYCKDFVNQNMSWGLKMKRHAFDRKRKRTIKLTIILWNKTQDIIIFVKADQNSPNILGFLYFPLNKTANIKSFVQFI